ncbi:MAG: DUF2341 domain-containing protein, partial [Promethearchaeota archaeon]
ERYKRIYNSTHALLTAWVKANLSNTQDTIISMYYGNPTLSIQENPSVVWDANYRSVWHLNNDPTGIINDSTSNNFDGSSGGSMTQNDLVSAKFATGIDFDGTNDYIAFPDPLNTETMTISAWVYLKVAVNDWITVAMRATTDVSWFDWQLYARASDGELSNEAVYRTLYPSTSEVGSNFVLSIGTWYYVVGQHNGTHNLFFIDGTLSEVDQDLNTVKDSNRDMWIGGNEVWGEWLQGILDEVRVSNIARSADWITTEYNNQNDSTSFYSTGIKESYDILSWPNNIFQYRKNVTIKASEVSGDLTNFPALIELFDTDLHNSEKVQPDGDDIFFIGSEDWIWSDELLINGGFESGSLIGWTSSGTWGVGTDPPQGAAGTQSGSYCAYVTANGAPTNYIRQDADISGYAEFIDNGKAICDASGWVVSAEDTFDECRIIIQYLDSAKSVISTPLDTGLQLFSLWTQRSIKNSPIPTNTRYIRVWATCYEDGWDAGSVDSFSLKIGILQESHSGFQLDHEVVLFDQQFNSTHAHLVAWVKIPSLSSSQNAIVSMYYGNPTVSNQENPSGVWDKNYIGVWHLNEDNSSTRYDSTNNNLDGTPGNYDNDEATTGIIDGADDFDGIDDHLVIQDPGIGSILDFDTGNSISISAWIHPESFPEYWNTFVTKGSTPSEFANYGLQVLGSGDSGKLDFFYRKSDNSDPWQEYQTNTDIISLGDWHFVVFTYTFGIGSSAKFYVNGTEIAGVWSSGNGDIDPLISNAELWFGADDNPPYDSPNELFDGIIDEIRISNVKHDENWIQTEYNNQFDPNNFYSVSIEEKNPNWWADGSFNKRRDLIINQNKVDGNLINFPLLIKLSDNCFKTGKIQPDGADILFVDMNGTKLAHEIESFTQNDTHGDLVVWVKVPLLKSSEDTIISMYYGNDGIINQENSEGVWTDYAGVWHFTETNGDVQDSTSYSTSGTISGTINQETSGQIGNAYDFTTTGKVNIGNPADGHLDFATDNFTFSCWLNLDQSTGNNQIPIWKGGTSAGTRGYSFVTTTAGTTQQAVISDGLGNQVLSAASISFDSWIHTVGVIDRSSNSIFIYTSGVLIDNNDISSVGSVSNSYAMTFSHSSYPFDGILDEVRVSRKALSADWILAEYNNQYDPSSFYSVGPELSLSADITIEKSLTVEAENANQIVIPNVTGVPNQLYILTASSKVYSDTTSVTGLGLNWIELEDQPSGRSQTGVSVWYSIGSNPITGDIIVSFASSPKALVAQVHRISGVHINNPIGDTESANTNGENGLGSDGTDDPYPYLDIITSTSNATIFGAIARRHIPISTPGLGYTLLTENQIGSSGDIAGISTEYKTGKVAGTKVVNATLGSNCDWAIAGIEIIPGVIDVFPPIVKSFGIDDPGTGIGTFWANIT